MLIEREIVEGKGKLSVEERILQGMESIEGNERVVGKDRCV